VAETAKPTGYIGPDLVKTKKKTPHHSLVQSKSREDDDPEDYEAWNSHQARHIDEEEYIHETHNPSKYMDKYFKDWKSKSGLMQMRNDTEPLHPYRHHAWTDDQYNASHEDEWDQETKNPTIKYRKPKDSLAQAPYVYRDHAWNDEQNDRSNEATWTAETNAPSGYQFRNRKAKGSLAQAPYDYREHAWNDDQNDRSNEATWTAETNAPSGY